MRNRYKYWTEDDIELLHLLLRENVSMSTISKVLGRSQRAISHALKNSIFHQLIHHHPTDVHDYYKHTTIDDNSIQDLVPEKYYTDIAEDGVVEESSSAPDVDESSRGNYVQLAMFALVSSTIACCAYYGWVLREQWDGMTCMSPF